MGILGGIEVCILVDFGSSHSFLSSSIAAQLPGVTHTFKPISVRLANGSIMQCTEELPAAVWSVQGYTFHSNFKILPLSSFDMIMGMDWLEAFSPMKIHWLQRWLCIPYGRSTVVLHGISPPSNDCQLLQLFLVSSELPTSQPEAVHLEVQPILQQFEHLFAEPIDLPPRQDCDHKIPLVPGATPVSIRQYRYSPALKTEIGTQVLDMLKTGFIRPSSSAFSSPVLMVQKKDGGW